MLVPYMTMFGRCVRMGKNACEKMSRKTILGENEREGKEREREREFKTKRREATGEASKHKHSGCKRKQKVVRGKRAS